MDIDASPKLPQGPVSWRPFWIVYPIIAASVIVAAWVVVELRIKQSVATIMQSERLVVERYVDLVSRQLRQASVDVCAFAKQNELRRYLDTGDKNALALGAKEFSTRMRLAGTYDHIRFIDNEGAEHLRVNLEDGRPVEVHEDQLQKKSERYYVHELRDIANSEIYISPIDLNYERGEIELPHKPVMRFGTQVRGVDGELEGFVIINVLAEPMLDAVVEQSRFNDGNPMLINEEGYWLVDPTMPASWGFLYPEFFDDRMPVFYPEEWELLRSKEKGEIRTDEGLFTFAHYLPVKEVGFCDPVLAPVSEEGAEDNFRWILASHVPASTLRERAWRIGQRAAIPTVLLLILLAGATRVGTVWVVRRRERHRFLEHRAGIDILTGLSNRAAFEDELREEAQRADRQGSKFAIVMADLDGFKIVNDSLGHKAGDRVLKEVAEVFRDAGRSTDTAARIGGDEFVVLLSGIADAGGARRVADTILERVGEIREGTFQIGASIGIAIYPDHTTDPGEVIVLADRAMYAAKRRGKNSVWVADELTHEDEAIGG